MMTAQNMHTCLDIPLNKELEKHIFLVVARLLLPLWGCQQLSLRWGHYYEKIYRIL